MINVKRLSIIPENKEFFCEASDLCDDYPQGLPKIITLFNEHTNGRALFLYDRTLIDQQENEITGWEYRPSSDTITNNRNLIGWKLIITND